MNWTEFTSAAPVRVLLVAAFGLTLGACGGDGSDPAPAATAGEVTSPAAPAPADEAGDELETQVARMAAIGYAASPTFSPDGERVAYVTAHEGVPQVWIAAADGSGDPGYTLPQEPNLLHHGPGTVTMVRAGGTTTFTMSGASSRSVSDATVGSPSTVGRTGLIGTTR